MELKDRFPDNVAEIDAYFEALLSAEEAGHMVGAQRAMPEPFRSAHHWWNKRKIQRWCSRTTGEVISELISNPKLAAVLSAQWGTYGGKPKEASFAVHATIMGHYLEGAAYPVGGAAAIAGGLVPVIEAAGGSARAATPVSEILLEDGKAVGVRTRSGEEINARFIVSAIGAGETVKHLLPEGIREQHWAREIATFKPSICHFVVFLGFEGDIAQYGATRSNHWYYESWDTNDAIWTAADGEPIPMMFVSFASLKDPAHDPGPSSKHTGEMLVWADWSSVAEFAAGGAKERPDKWGVGEKGISPIFTLRLFFSDGHARGKWTPNRISSRFVSAKIPNRMEPRWPRPRSASNSASVSKRSTREPHLRRGSRGRHSNLSNRPDCDPFLEALRRHSSLHR